ncbi:2 cyclic-nucleotide 3-phosphodiesterase [Neofusicoccum parvum]|uniref:2 cyclic-nucleotide 3-phosphodiesterase n=1 Tax=Neofusicoccum parvum TaxID=310453 RepID=A0ACB5RRI4_9PEZI|nr:2 cyclic-nucleotide 3-phosphodiesterase [Neofusicoccum parvum]
MRMCSRRRRQRVVASLRCLPLAAAPPTHDVTPTAGSCSRRAAAASPSTSTTTPEHAGPSRRAVADAQCLVCLARVRKGGEPHPCVASLQQSPEITPAASSRTAGFSLWLVPPDSSPVYRALSALIADTLPAQFPAASPPSFVPHVTLTSDVPSATFTTSSDEAQQKRDARAWLDSLGPLLPANHDVRVRFEALDVGERFVQKLTLRVRKEGGLAQLARVSRLQGVLGGADADVAESWLEQSYRPHCSLV